MSSLVNEAAADPLHRFWNDTLEEADPEVAAIIGRELGRQRDRIELIASENIASPAVLEATGSVFTNKYAEGYPGRRYTAAATMPMKSRHWRSSAPSSCSAASPPTSSPTAAAR